MKQKEQTVSPLTSGTTVVKAQLSLPSALQILNYLQVRNRICNDCGYRWATQASQFHVRCDKCVEECKTHPTYAPIREGTAFERILSKRLEHWADTVLSNGAL